MGWLNVVAELPLYGRMLIYVLVLVGGVYLWTWLMLIHPHQLYANDAQQKNANMTQREGSMKVGKDSVVMGNVPSNLEVGDGSVVVGPTDANGNTILNQPMAVGHNVRSSPGSIAIGANAGAGLPTDLEKDSKK